jgi:hypothetical protein
MRGFSTVIVTLALVAGCGRHQHGPLDNATLDILSRTRMSSASVTYPDGYNATLARDQYDMMRNLIASLSPIRSVKEATLEDYDYQLVYHAGMDPAIINVKLSDENKLTYKWDDYVYTGGDLARFRNGVNAIRQQDESMRDD